jgi:hypothetical protein
MQNTQSTISEELTKIGARTFGARGAKVKTRQSLETLENCRAKRELLPSDWTTFGILERVCKVRRKCKSRKPFSAAGLQKRRRGLLNDHRRKSRRIGSGKEGE